MTMTTSRGRLSISTVLGSNSDGMATRTTTSTTWRTRSRGWAGPKVRIWSRLKHRAPATAERKKQSGIERMAPPARRRKKRTVSPDPGPDPDRPRRAGSGDSKAAACRGCGGRRWATGFVAGRPLALCCFFEAATASR